MTFLKCIVGRVKSPTNKALESSLAIISLSSRKLAIKKEWIPVCMGITNNVFSTISLSICIAALVSFLPVVAIFEHDRAAVAYHKGDYGHSRDLMQKALIYKPDDPVCLYDSGVVAYKNNDFDQAQAYFSSVTQQPNIDAPLLEKAHFNRAKVYEKRDEYAQAIEQYTRVLEINADNYKAQQEKSRLEKLLEKQKKEQEQEKEKEQQQKSSDQKNSQQQNSQNQQSSHQDAQHDKQSQPDAGSQPQQGDKQRSQTSKNQEKDNNNGQQQEAEQKPFGNEQDTKKETEQAIDKKTEHAKSPEKEIEKSALDHKGSSKKSIAEKKSTEQPQQADALDGAPSTKKMDIMLERILAEQEKNDASLNKKYIKATVKQHMAGGNDQNCW